MAVRPETTESQLTTPSKGRPGPDAEPAISVRGVGKKFLLAHHQTSTLKERVLHPFRRRGHDQLEALRNVSFDIKQGEFFGVIGRNGSGKSTLLKCLAGIYQPSEGEIVLHGRLSPFIELGVGFNPDLNALDNVTVNATLIGLTPSEARRRFRDVITFAELEDFVEMKLKNYSSGMQVRLGFATAIQVDADILLIDEVLAVGDALFQRKCFDTFHRLKDEGQTIVYVSHDLDTVKRFADRALLLDEGEIVAIDVPDVVIQEYGERNRIQEEGREAQAWQEEERLGDGSAEITDAWFEDEHGARTATLRQGEPVSFRFEARFHCDMDNPILGFNVQDEKRRVVLNVNSLWSGCETGAVAAGEVRTFIARFPNWLGAGDHCATPIVAYSDGQRWADLRDRYVRIEVQAPVTTGGLVDLPQEVEVLPA